MKKIVLVLMLIGSLTFAENYKTVFDYKEETGRVYYLDLGEKREGYKDEGRVATKLEVRLENSNADFKSEINYFKKISTLGSFNYYDVMYDLFATPSGDRPWGGIEDILNECWGKGEFSREGLDEFPIGWFDGSDWFLLKEKPLVDEHILSYLEDYNYVYVWDEDLRVYYNIFHTIKGYGFYAIAYVDMQPWNYNSKNWLVNMFSRQTEVNNKLEVEQ